MLIEEDRELLFDDMLLSDGNLFFNGEGGDHMIARGLKCKWKEKEKKGTGLYIVKRFLIPPPPPKFDFLPQIIYSTRTRGGGATCFLLQ